MQNLEMTFFKVYGIKPLIKKGETYFTGSVRFASVEADVNIYPVINGETILLLESCLGDFSIKRQVAPSEILTYSYQVNDKIGKYAVSRKDALLDYLVEYCDFYKDTVPAVFTNQMVG